MTKIVVADSMRLTEEHQARLNKLGEVKFYDSPPASPEDWLKRCQGYDIICSNVRGFYDKWHELRDCFVSVRFVGVGFIDPAVLEANNVQVSNSPGCNSHAVAEWAVGMMIIMAHQLDKFLNVERMPAGQLPEPTLGLAQKRVTILGKGYIGSKIGKACEALSMEVDYFQRGDSLADKVKHADFVINALSVNSSTKNLLGEQFFGACKRGAIFISVAAEPIIDFEAMFAALDSGQLAYAAHDAVNPQVAETNDPLYQRLRNHPHGYVTPHIAFNTDVSWRIGNDMMIDNVEVWLKGRPVHLIGTC